MTAPPVNVEPDAAPCESWGCCHACETCDRYCSYDAWKARHDTNATTPESAGGATE